MTALVEDSKGEAQGPSGPGIGAPPWDHRRDRRAALLLFLVVWVVYLATASYTVSQVTDNRSMTLMAWSLGTRGTIDLPQEWRGDVPWEVDGVDGSLHTNRFPGAWLWAAPFHAAAELLLDRGTPPHPVLLNYAPSGVAAATASALAIVASFLVFRRLADRRLALSAAGVLAFATGVWSVSADAMWTHSVTHLMIMLGLISAASRHNAISGLAFACSILARPQTAIVPAVVGLWRGLSARSLRPVLVIGLTSAVGVASMAAYSKVVFGTWLPVAGYDPGPVESVASIAWTDFFRRLAGGFADPERGILVYTPFVLVLLPFVRRGWLVSEWWVRAAAVSGLAYYVVQMRANHFSGGDDFFGSRLGIEMLVLSAPLLLRTWQAYVDGDAFWRRITIGLIAVSFVLHAAGASALSTSRPAAALWEERIAEACDEFPEHLGC